MRANPTTSCNTQTRLYSRVPRKLKPLLVHTQGVLIAPGQHQRRRPAAAPVPSLQHAHIQLTAPAPSTQHQQPAPSTQQHRPCPATKPAPHAQPAHSVSSKSVLSNVSRRSVTPRISQEQTCPRRTHCPPAPCSIGTQHQHQHRVSTTRAASSQHWHPAASTHH